MAPSENSDSEPAVRYPRLVLYGLAITIGIALAVAASTSGAAFGAYNPSWDGASQLQAEATAVGSNPILGRSVSAYDEVPPNETVAVVLSPDRAYTTAELTQIRQFVRAGGMLVVAEDYGPHSNALLAAVGASARVDGRVLRDERYHYRSPAMPIATNITNRSLVAGVDRLTLNHGTVVEPNNASILASSSGYAYLDENQNGKLDANETLGSYPVATVEPVGAGRVVVVSDPSIMINAMLDQTDNRAFVRSLFDGHERVLLDYSHTERLPPLAVATLLVRETPLLQVVLALLLVGSVVVWRRRSDFWVRAWTVITGQERRGETADGQVVVDDDTLVAYLLDQHPEWSRDRARRVIRNARRKDDD